MNDTSKDVQLVIDSIIESAGEDDLTAHGVADMAYAQMADIDPGMNIKYAAIAGLTAIAGKRLKSLGADVEDDQEQMFGDYRRVAIKDKVHRVMGKLTLDDYVFVLTRNYRDITGRQINTDLLRKQAETIYGVGLVRAKLAEYGLDTGRLTA